MTLAEQHELQLVADDFKAQVVNAIKTKMVRRRSRRPGKGIFEAPVNASGKLAASVHSEFNDDGIEVLCNEYIEKLIFGQAPGGYVKTSDIEGWLIDKNLNMSAAGIAAQIEKFGSSIWQEHKGQDSGLLEDIDISNSVDRLRLRLTEKYADLVGTEIIEQFKMVA